MIDFEPELFLKHLNGGIGPKGIARGLRDACHWAGALPASDEEYQRAGIAYRERLLDLVREWVRSGIRRKLGKDLPKKRKLKLGAATHLALAKWAGENVLRSQIVATGDALWRAERPSLKPEKGVQHRPIKAAQGNAVAQFAGLLNSPLKYALSQCGRCSEYYFRGKLREVYDLGKGYYCSKCRSAASSKRRTEEKRKEKDREVLTAARGAAIEAFAKWATLAERTRTEYGVRDKYIFSRVTSRVEGFGLTSKWVTRNRYRWGEQNGKG